MRRHLIFLIGLTVLLWGCKKSEHKSSSVDYKKIVDTMQVRQDSLADSLKAGLSKVIVIDTPSVVFFMPNYQERQQIIQFYANYDPYDFNNIFNNFQRIAYDAREPLSKFGIKSFLTYNWKFKIKTDSGYVEFNRKAQGQVLGIILADCHHQPVIKFGLYRYLELQKLIQQYFKIPDFQFHYPSVYAGYGQNSVTDGNP